MVPVQRPATMGSRKRRLSASLPWCAMASTAPSVSIWHRLNARLDDFHISSTAVDTSVGRSEEHTSELQSQSNLVCRLLLEKKKKQQLQKGDSYVQGTSRERA